MIEVCLKGVQLCLLSLLACATTSALATTYPEQILQQTAPGQASGQGKLVQTGEVPEGLSGTDWSGIQAQIAAGKYHAYPDQNDGFVSSNPAHGWQIHYAADGTTTLSPRDHEAQAYQLGFKLSAVGFSKLQTLGEPQGVTEDGFTVSYQWTDSLREWWVNSEDGLEQWFELEQRPPGAQSGQDLTLEMTLATDLTASQKGNTLAFVSDGSGNAPGTTISYDKLIVWDASGRKLPAHMQLRPKRLSLVIDDSDARYPLTIDPAIRQQAYLKASNTGTNDYFGNSVAIDGDTLVVGSFLEGSNATGVDGDQANNSAGASGAAYVFTRSAGVWSQQAYLKASNTETSDNFGHAVAIAGDTLVVGAVFENSNATGIDGDQANNSEDNSGAAYVFTRSAGVWSQQAYLKASNTDADDNFGYSVAIAGDTVVVGAHQEDSNTTGINATPTNNFAVDSGAAYVFTRSAGVWSQQAYIKASNITDGDSFGNSVAIDGDTAVVGAWFEDSNATGFNGNQTNNSATDSGAAYVYTRITVSIYGNPINFGTGSDNTRIIAFGDVDGDGDLDLATGNDGQNTVYLYDSVGGTYGNPINFGTGSDDTYSIAFGDVDGDGYLDLATGNYGQQNVVYLYDSVGGTYGSPLSFGTGSDDTYSIAFGDVDGDGYLDLAIGNDGQQNAVYLYDSAFGGTYGSPIDFGTGSDDTYSIAFGDVDGDGYLDLATGNYGQQNAVYLYDSVGDTYGSPINFGTGSDDTYSITFGDVDGDGYLDLATGNDAQNTVYLYDSVGGTYGSPINFGTGSDDTYSIAFGDVDGDGDLDLATGNDGQQNAVYRYDSVGGTYGNPINFGTGSDFTWSVAFGDVDNDGDPDLATGNDGQQNAVYLYDTIGVWSQQAYLKASNTGAGDFFALSVAIASDTLVVGAAFEDSNATGFNGDQGNNSATNSGAAYVFTRNAEIWSQQAYLKASNTGDEDHFGNSVAITSDTVVVGAPQENSDAKGVNGNQFNDVAGDSGAAYVFTRSTGVWSQRAYLKASNTDGLDYFGHSVAITSDTVVVGAPQEDSNATGVNGDQANNSASDSGAAYVFDLAAKRRVFIITE